MDVRAGGLKCDGCGNDCVTVYYTILCTAHVCPECGRWAVAYGDEREGIIVRQPKLDARDRAHAAIVSALAGGPPDATLISHQELVVRFKRAGMRLLERRKREGLA